MIEQLPQLNTTIIKMLPEPVVGLLQQLVNSIYILMGGVVGFFIISFLLEWRKNYLLKKKLDRIESIVKSIDRKLRK